jgi:hypothetical protein
MAAIASEVLVPLCDGSAVPAHVLLWYLDAADRGIELRAEPEGMLFVGPAAKVTRADREFAGANKWALFACIRHVSAQAGRPS